MEKSLKLRPDSAAAFLGRIPLASLLQRLPGVVALFFVPFCFFGPIYTPTLFAAYFVFLHLAFAYNATRTAYGARVASVQSRLHFETDWYTKYSQEVTDNHDLPYDAIRHIIIIPQYKEDLGTMYDTLDVLASHPQALTNYKICLAMEEAEVEAPMKGRGLIEKYHNLFNDITMTLHPSGRVGEIRGKSSNVAWAAKEMVRQAGGARLEDIFTVMDADSCFAADYFAALSYHYAVATPRERGLLFFAPPTVFDRNSDQVPFLVRVADMQWSMGVISNMYKGSSFTPPCSAYSIPMKFAVAVGLWDSDPTSLGEDFHMYIKCFFSTHGEIILKPIFSPLSCCNVVGQGYLGGLNARRVQSKRHLWGALDLGYTLRRAIYGLFAPTYDAPRDILQPIPFVTEHSSYNFSRLASQLFPFIYRVLECHVLVGQVFLMMLISQNIIPTADGTGWFWNKFSSEEVHPYVSLATWIGARSQNFVGFIFLFAIMYYEKYQKFAGVERWQAGEKLGIRSRIQSKRSWMNLIEWLAIPLVGLIFMVLPQVYVHIYQIFTDSLEYVVAGKPKHEVLIKEKEKDRDSGFYDFAGEESVNVFSPDMWSKKSNLTASISTTSVQTLAN